MRPVRHDATRCNRRHADERPLGRRSRSRARSPTGPDDGDHRGPCLMAAQARKPGRNGTGGEVPGLVRGPNPGMDPPGMVPSRPSMRLRRVCICGLGRAVVIDTERISLRSRRTSPFSCASPGSPDRPQDRACHDADCRAPLALPRPDLPSSGVVAIGAEHRRSADHLARLQRPSSKTRSQGGRYGFFTSSTCPSSKAHRRTMIGVLKMPRLLPYPTTPIPWQGDRVSAADRGLKRVDGRLDSRPRWTW